MAKTLSFDDGLVEYEINGRAKARFNPTDASFVERFYKAFKELESRQEEFKARVDAIGEDREGMFEYARERDAEMREVIDGLLGQGVSDALFSEMNCYALADGAPVWVNLMFAVAEEIDAGFTDEQKRADPRARQFDAKHAELLAKYRKATTKR